jgi:D-alanyl-D-alanine dipeptidase
MRTLFLRLGALGLVAFAFIPHPTSAQIHLEVGIGSLSQLTEPYLANYIVNAYQFIVSSIGIVAAVMIMFNGMRWVTAGGNSENVGVAKTGISNAIIGLLIAVTSYVLLNAVNPSLVGFKELDQSELTFREPVTTSEAALSSGSIADDGTLVHYMDSTGLPADLRAYLSNSADEPYITQPTFAALQSALTKLRDDPSYQGMKLVIASANRTLNTQERLWACYQYKKNNGSCPSGCGRCSTAAVPGTSRHGFGNALDVSWTNTGSGKYVTTTGFANSDWHKACLINNKPVYNKNGTISLPCTTELKNSVQAFNTMMQSAGFSRICIEWWHHQIGGSTDSLCSPGQYK